MKNKVIDLTSGEERALYNLNDSEVVNCTFAGPEDGESALKEARNIDCVNCNFNLRYPLWHVKKFTLNDSKMSETCRAPMWYSIDGVIRNTYITGVKALRECKNISIYDSKIVSDEFGWNTININLKDVEISSMYLLFGAKNIKCDNIKQSGKYTYQYVKNCVITNSVLDTKDAFWHSKNCLIMDSVVKGEYLAWYSENLTLINCKISGTQPFCYAKNLKLINCTMEGCDLAFEYSSVKASIIGDVVSIKNPLKGKITLTGTTTIISDNPVYKTNCKIIQGVK